jgi:hypothetical protein
MRQHIETSAMQRRSWAIGGCIGLAIGCATYGWLVSLAALCGVGFWLPLAPGLRLALQLLVLGVGLAALQFGIGLVRSLPADERPESERVRAD